MKDWNKKLRFELLTLFPINSSKTMLTNLQNERLAWKLVVWKIHDIKTKFLYLYETEIELSTTYILNFHKVNSVKL